MAEANDVNVDTSNDTTQEVDNTTDVEVTPPGESAEDKATRLEEQNKQLFVRAKKAEGFTLVDGKWVKQSKPAPAVPTPTPSTSTVSPEELRLIAKGLSDELIDQAKAISAGKGIPLADALKDPLFTAYQTVQAEEKKKEDAKLGASHGSGQEGSSNVFKPGMTEEEHREAWKKAQGL